MTIKNIGIYLKEMEILKRLEVRKYAFNEFLENKRKKLSIKRKKSLKRLDNTRGL